MLLGAGYMVQQEKKSMSQKSKVQFPVAILGDSKQFQISAPGDQTPLASVGSALMSKQLPALPHTYTQLKIKYFFK